MSVVADIEADGIRDFSKYIEMLPAIANEAALMAVNQTARDARSMARRDMLDNMNWPASYLNESRLALAKRATKLDLTAEIKGRDRPTSLARFSTTPIRFGRQRGVHVKVLRSGGTAQLKRGFYMRLRRGRTMDTENPNVGLAVRLGKGESLSNSVGALNIGGGVYLLYGPSVNQVFGNIANDILDDVSEKLESQFIRQFTRLQNERQ